MNNILTVAATVADDLKAFRSGAVTAENRGDVSARSLCAALVAGQYTVALATSAIIHAFGNPKGKSGKPIDKLSGLRSFVGGDAVRKMATDIFNIFENIDADAPKVVPATVEGEADTTVGAGAIRPLVEGFILQSEGAPKSLRALREAVAAALRAHAKAISPDNGDAVNDNADDEAALTSAAVAPFDPADAIAKLTVFFGSMNIDAAEAAGPLVTAMMQAYDNRVNALTDSGEAIAA